jgi:hypothetical protein
MARRGKSNKSVSLAPVRGLTPLRLPDQGGPTPERLAKLPGVTIIQRAGGTKIVAMAPGTRSPVGADGVVRVSQSPLDRLEALHRLAPGDSDRNTKLHDAGDRLRQHWYLAGLDGGPGSIDLNRAGGGNGHPAWLTPSSESAAYHRQRFRAARDGMEAGHWQIVFGICCGEATLEAAGRDAGFGNAHAANAVALDRLRRGLELLALAWGILPPRPANDDHLANPAARVATRVVDGDEVGRMIDRMVIANAAERIRKTG